MIGLDGATFDLIKPWAEEGKLPTFKKLMEEGVWGELESTIPPITGPAWLALATGRNPGKTGAIDFMNRRYGSHELEVVNSSYYKGISIWDYLSFVRLVL